MQLNALLNPLKLSAAISLVGLLTACSGNSSTTTSGPSQVVTPIAIDKTMTPVEWDSANYVTNASHAYRVITKNSMLEYVFTNRLAAFDTLVNLLRVDTNKNCAISGRIEATNVGDVCYDDNEDKETCNSSPITENIQESQAIACQDGTVSGLYFDGFFNLTARTDLTELDEKRTSTIISAEGQAATHDANGNLMLDEFGDTILGDFTDYLFQSDISTFFFDHEYVSYVDFSTNVLDCSGTEYQTVNKQGIRSSKVGTQEGDGTDNFYLYTELTDLDLKSIPTEVCDGDKQVVTYAYSFTATMTNAAMGGTDSDTLETSNTLVTWPDMDISVTKDSSGILISEPSGVMTLVHENTAGDYTVTADFNTDGQVTLTPDVGAPSTLTLSEFLELSKPVTPEPAAE
jgi:hypothetical protein